MAAVLLQARGVDVVTEHPADASAQRCRVEQERRADGPLVAGDVIVGLGPRLNPFAPVVGAVPTTVVRCSSDRVSTRLV